MSLIYPFYVWSLTGKLLMGSEVHIVIKTRGFSSKGSGATPGYLQGLRTLPSVLGFYHSYLQ